MFVEVLTIYEHGAWCCAVDLEPYGCVERDCRFVCGCNCQVNHRKAGRATCPFQSGVDEAAAVSPALMLDGDVHADDGAQVPALGFILSEESDRADEVALDETAEEEGVG